MQISELKPIKKFSIDVPSISECKLKADKLRAENHKIDPAIDPEKISLTLIKSGIAALKKSDQRKLPYYLLSEKFKDYNPTFTKAVLNQCNPDKKFINTLFDAWVFDYQPDTKNGKVVKDFLNRYKHRLSDEDREINKKFNIIKGVSSKDKAIKAFIDGQIEDKNLDFIGINQTGLISTKYSNAFLTKVCEHITKNSLNENQISNIINSFSNNEIVHQSMKSFALVALINSLTAINQNNDLHKRVIDLIQNSFGDPRRLDNLSKRWPFLNEDLGGIRERDKCIEKVNKWLNLRSIEIFFDIIERVEVPLDDRHMFPARRDFWTKIINDDVVSEITVILSRQGVEVANNLSMKDPNIGNLEWGTNKEADRCTLLLKIGTLLIMDWSHVGAIRIYDASIPKNPQLNQNAYSKSQLNVEDDFGGRENWGWIPHDKPGRWRKKVVSMINDHSGMRIRL